MSRILTVSTWRATLMAAILVLFPAVASAQTGRITGTVTDQQGGAVYGAQVSVVGTRIGTLSNMDGQFILTGVPAGTNQLRVSYIGYREEVVPVSVTAGEATSVDVRLEGSPVELGGVVVSASRRAQRITDAPATITRVDPSVIENSPGNNWAGALKQAVGLDFIQVGMTGVAINARGFNSSFNNRMLMMEDGRIAVLPENGLPVGQFTAIPKVDLAGVEVLVGPGAALYGADASNGVVTLLSKDPRQFPGTTVEVSGGNRQYKDIQARHAGVLGDWGYKVTGEWQDAMEWGNRIGSSAAPTSPRERTVGDSSGVDWNSSVTRGTAALVRYMDNGRFELSAGASETDGVGQTSVGRNQLVGWQYNFAQARLTLPNWFFQAYRTQSQSGESYAINRFTDNRVNPANASKSDEEIRLMSDWPSNGRLYAAEAQNNFRVPGMLNTAFVWGAQYRRDVVSSDGEWLTDRLTGEDLEINQFGVYAQSETPLMPWLDVVLAARYDDHENYDPQFSPKAGLVVKPSTNQAVRLTYNRAFKSPTTLQTNFYIPDFAVVTPTVRVGVFGNTEGFTTKAADGSVLTRYTPLVPEENQTWELGYKGVLANRLFVDVTGYRSKYENFLSPLTNIGVSYRNDQLVTNEAGNPQLVFTYFNLGTARLRGVDAGLNFVATPTLNFTGTVSVADLESVEGMDIKLLNGQPDEAKIRELSTLNSPTTKWTVGANSTNLASVVGGTLLGGATVRHVNGYSFASGINRGKIPTFTTLDLTLGYKLPGFNNMSVNVGVNNLFTCRSSDPNSGDDESKCGFDTRHIEMVNMPSIGTMVFVGARYHVQ
jgi:outer membrane receptor for ferrienterochelin and colicins